jgi:hypothetical protein
VVYVVALETANGAISVFTSPTPWGVGGTTPTVNGRTCVPEDYTILSSTQVQFVEPPRMGDVVGFYVATM